MGVTLTNLRTVRTERRLSQRKLAVKAGFRDANRIWMAEALMPVSPDDAAKLAQALGVTVGLLAGRPLVKLPTANGDAERPGA